MSDGHDSNQLWWSSLMKTGFQSAHTDFLLWKLVAKSLISYLTRFQTCLWCHQAKGADQEPWNWAKTVTFKMFNIRFQRCKWSRILLHITWCPTWFKDNEKCIDRISWWQGKNIALTKLSMFSFVLSFWSGDFFRQSAKWAVFDMTNQNQIYFPVKFHDPAGCNSIHCAHDTNKW